MHSVTQLCPILCDPMGCSLPGCSVHGIFQARILGWVAISYSRGSSQARNRNHVSCISCIGRWTLYQYPSEKPFEYIGGGWVTKSCLTLATPWTAAYQAPLSMGFSSQKYWSGLPFPFPGDLPDLGVKPRSSATQADSLPTELQGKSFEQGGFQ